VTNRKLPPPPPPPQVSTYFPWFLRTYDKLPRSIMRADAARSAACRWRRLPPPLPPPLPLPPPGLLHCARLPYATGARPACLCRYCYMYMLGGVYADLDLEALKPQDALLAGRQAVLAWMGPPDPKFEHNIPNAWMASEPGHPFWVMMLFYIMQVGPLGAGVCGGWCVWADGG
jgi:mannosyltransferase OCH1-like enzyme